MPMRNRGGTWLGRAVLVSAATGTACGSDARTSVGGISDRRGDSGDLVDAGDAGSLPRSDRDAGTGCEADLDDPPPEAVCVESISGRVVDGTGDPAAPDLLVSACGPAECTPGFTDSTGRFRIDVGFHLVPRIYAVQVHARPALTAFYFPLDPDARGAIDVGDLRVFSMPERGPAIDVDRAGAPAQALDSGDVRLEVADGVFVRLDPDSNLAGEQGREFRALRIPEQRVHEFVDPSLLVTALYALEPFESSFELPGSPAAPTGVRLSFTNPAAWLPGSVVEILALGSYVFPDWIPPATFAVAASARVSADGTRVDMDPNETIPHLTWVGLRVAESP